MKDELVITEGLPKSSHKLAAENATEHERTAVGAARDANPIIANNNANPNRQKRMSVLIEEFPLCSVCPPSRKNSPR